MEAPAKPVLVYAPMSLYPSIKNDLTMVEIDNIIREWVKQNPNFQLDPDALFHMAILDKNVNLLKYYYLPC